MLRGLGTLVVFVAFIGLVFWAYNGKRKSSFDEAANLPFADDASDTTNSAKEPKE
ncbi:cytochrome c oxidase cbb3-type subunit 4 [Thiopseudomonas denitrificans]|uniref:Cytochrome c oxidase cbb3-type subunit 4 n=2 Tax=Thiopseudomonas denitrificans TaxID=1501432 RepID=A0A4R6TX95_9GAMM|nr:cytochrome c oxidase cbb3-type subunit 4 [Thiopseudomonas denitrificans]